MEELDERALERFIRQVVEDGLSQRATVEECVGALTFLTAAVAVGDWRAVMEWAETTAQRPVMH